MASPGNRQLYQHAFVSCSAATLCVCLLGEDREWGPWGPCSVTCGSGVRYRVRAPCVYSTRMPDCSVDWETKQREICSLPECPCKYHLPVCILQRLQNSAVTCSMAFPPSVPLTHHSHHPSPFDRAHTTSHSTLIETMCLSFTVFEI